MSKINKSLVNKRFTKSINTYNSNAIVQKQMAEKLIDVLHVNNLTSFNSAFEIGCGTGLLTELISTNLKVNTLIVNDLIVELESTIKEKINIQSFKFVGGDIENIDFSVLNNCDLVISNASLQWLNNFKDFASNLSNSIPENGVFAFTSFCKQNLVELKDLTKVGLEYFSLQQYIEILSKYFDIIYAKEEFVKLYFDSSIEVLKHLKNTGVNALTVDKWTKNDFMKLETDFSNKYKDEKGLFITFNPSYFICRNK